MINSLKNLFKKSEVTEDAKDGDLYLLCGLMMEAANIDEKVDQVEVDKISYALINIFGEDPSLVENQLNKCLSDINNNNKSLHYFTSKINKSFSDEKKMLLIEVLWEIILEDGKIHDFESNLIRRLSGLLYISDVNCGNAKKNAEANLKRVSKN